MIGIHRPALAEMQEGMQQTVLAPLQMEHTNIVDSHCGSSTE